MIYLFVIFGSFLLQNSILMNKRQNRFKRLLFALDYDALFYAVIHFIHPAKVNNLIIITMIMSFLRHNGQCWLLLPLAGYAFWVNFFDNLVSGAPWQLCLSLRNVLALIAKILKISQIDGTTGTAFNQHFCLFALDSALLQKFSILMQP